MHFRLWAVGAALLLLMGGCGSGPEVEPGTPAGAFTSAVRGQTLSGKVVLLPFVPVVDPTVRQILLGLRSELEKPGGPRITPDGSAIVWPPSPGSEWFVEVNGLREVVLEDGSFTLGLPNGPDKARLYSPNGDFEPVEFSIASLSPDPSQPRRLVVPIPFKGPCLMSEGDTDEFCLPESIQPRYIAPDLSEDPNGVLGVIRQARGTYPPPRLAAGCPDTDGPLAPSITEQRLLNLVGKPITAIQRRTASELVAYLGSTCDQNVRDGACINENGLTNKQYSALAQGGTGVFLARNVLRELFPAAFAETDELLLPTASLGNIKNCKVNHKNRVCSNFQLGDVSIDLDGVIRSGQRTVQVVPGQVGSFVVHNNGAFGHTFIKRTGAEGVVVLNPMPEDPAGQPPTTGLVIPPLDKVGPNTQRLRHYNIVPGTDSPSTSPYQTDRLLRYSVSEDAEIGDKVSFRFMVDDGSVQLDFEVTERVVKVTPQQTLLLRGQSVGFTAHLDLDPSLGEVEYEWALDRLAGTLNTNRGKQVQFTAGGGGVDGPREELKVSAYVTVNQRRVRVGRGSALIDIGNLAVLPASARLPRGASQEFVSQLQGLPAGVAAEYEWRSLQNLGLLATPDQANTVYTVRDQAQPGQTDQLQLKVFITTAQGRELFAEVLVPIEIERAAGGELVMLRVLGDDLTKTTLLPYGLDLASGQLSPFGTSLALTPRSGIGFGGLDQLVLSPTGNRAYYSRLSGSDTNNQVEVIEIDPVTRAMTVSDTVPLIGPQISVSKNGFANLRSPGPDPRDIVHHMLDATGSPRGLSTLLSPGADFSFGREPRFIVVTSPQGGEYLYSFRQGQIYGYRIQNGTATQLPGTPFNAPEASYLAVRPDMTSLLWLQNGTFSGSGVLALHAVRLDPSSGAVLGPGSTYNLPGGLAFLSFLKVSESGRIVLYRNVENYVLQVNSSGVLSFVTTLVAGGGAALDPSGQYLIDAFGGEVRTYRLSDSGATLVDTDPVGAFEITTRSTDD